MIRDKNIICFGFAEWDARLRTNQHYIVEFLSKSNKVLFIESLGLRRPTLQKKDILRMVWRLIKFFKGVSNPQENLYVYSPLVLPLHKYKIVRYINDMILKLQLDIIIQKFDFKKNIILWGYVPNMIDFLKRYDEILSVYHCVDELSANPLIPKDFVKQKEQELLKKVSVVLVSSKTLYEERKKLHPKVYYLPNVADFEHFNKATLEDIEIPKDLQKIPSPRIGLVGALSRYKVDFGLIKSIAVRHKEWSFVLIGPTGEGEEAFDIEKFFEDTHNVHLLGFKEYRILPNYLKGFDVCIIPSVINDYTQNMFPLKFFEYLATGKPVVVVEIKPLLEFREYCYLSKNLEDFEKNIFLALNEPVENRYKRISLARKFSWDKRFEEITRIINENLT
ncbi:MAG: glycosyltransferase [Endomicrobia bacterium]|nr:glycosyltransferase [Endomicrobiia bacterium]